MRRLARAGGKKIQASLAVIGPGGTLDKSRF
jgi:hypothetical protein